MKFLGVVVAAALAVLTSNLASAQVDLLNTGTPTGTGPVPELLGSTTQYGVEFTISSPETLSSISTYFTPLGGSGSAGATYEYFLYSGTALTRNSLAIDTAAEIWSGTSGWDSSDVNWSLAPGTYTLALQSTDSVALDLPPLASTTSGTTPALGWQDKNGSNWSASGASTFGIEVQAEAVPEPSSWLLGLAAIGVFGLFRIRRRRSS